MGLYERLLGYDENGVSVNGKITVHSFAATMAEYGRGVITGAQAQAIMEWVSGMPLTPSEAAEAQTLVNTITGSTTAKLARVKLIDDVLMLGEHGAPGYNLPSLIRTRLGV